MTEPGSELTRERPDLWRRGLALATSLTGYVYAPKLPLADGTIYACGGHVDRQIHALGLDVEAFRVVWGEWVRWGAGKNPGHRPWEKTG
jgi:hypothetical protein